MSAHPPPDYTPAPGPNGPVQHIRPAEHGGDVWLIQDNEETHRWTASWIEGEDGLTDFIGTEQQARAWADSRPAEHWYVFDPALDDWVEYRPTGEPPDPNESS